ncbi:MAG: helix-turn-helix domain-containing protein [Nitrosopumilus sp.]
MSKQEQIEKHLLSGQTITGLQAIDLFGVYRLSSVINRLRKKSIPIETTMVLSGDGETLFARYWIPINKR